MHYSTILNESLSYLKFQSHDRITQIVKSRRGNFKTDASQPKHIRSKKDPHIETLRGLAIILVVFGHIIGYDKTGGMRVADDSIYRYLYYSLEYIRMPLFTVIFGWVYANKPILGINHISTFISGKAKRILIPMFTVGTLLFLMRIVTPGTNTSPDIANISRNLIFPYDIFWYLYSIFSVFIITSLIDTYKWFRQFNGWLGAFAAAVVISVISFQYLDKLPNVFSFKGATYLLPYFILGIGLYRFKALLLSTKVLGFLISGLIISLSFQQLVWFYGLEHPDRTSFLGFTVGICGTMLLFKANFVNNILVRIGHYAFTIFLFHVFFTGGTRIILQQAGIYNKLTILAIALCMAIIFPILAETILKKHKLLRMGLLGMK